MFGLLYGFARMLGPPAELHVMNMGPLKQLLL